MLSVDGEQNSVSASDITFDIWIQLWKTQNIFLVKKHFQSGFQNLLNKAPLKKKKEEEEKDLLWRGGWGGVGGANWKLANVYA